jgi:prohibitin 2
MSKLIYVTIFHGISLTPLYLGEAIGSNPGYLKLRKIRASQSIARTVSKVFDFSAIHKITNVVFNLSVQIAQAQNRVYLNGSNLMLNLNDPAFDDLSEKLLKGKKK